MSEVKQVWLGLLRKGVRSPLDSCSCWDPGQA
jgi:hypothetical protein